MKRSDGHGASQKVWLPHPIHLHGGWPALRSKGGAGILFMFANKPLEAEARVAEAPHESATKCGVKEILHRNDYLPSLRTPLKKGDANR